MTVPAPPPLLQVRDLSIAYRTSEGPLRAVRDLTLDLSAGQTLALLGESGCGKSTLGRALLGLLPPGGHIEAGNIIKTGDPRMDLACCSNRDWRAYRGRLISLILQDPVEALNPLMTVGAQIIEAIRAKHGERSRRKKMTLDMLRAAGFHDPKAVLRSYPSQLSGGMNQRVAIVIALINGPSILVADEPTTALDVRVQADILALIKSLQETLGLALLLISHDLSVAAEMADRAAIMYAGRLVEIGPIECILNHPAHPYTKALIACFPDLDGARPKPLEGTPPSLSIPFNHCAFLPRCERARDDCRFLEQPALSHRQPTSSDNHLVACHHPQGQTAEQLTEAIPNTSGERPPFPSPFASPSRTDMLRVNGLVKIFSKRGSFPGQKKHFRAVDGVSFALLRGEILGLVGESGCGKTTLARCIIGLETPTSGQVRLNGTDMPALKVEAWRQLRRLIQPVFQHPRGSLNPSKTILDLVQEPWVYFKTHTQAERVKKAGDLLEMVALPQDVHQKRPDELSTGQCQRVTIARALAMDPQYLICDEPVSALDLSVQAQIINLLLELNQKQGFGMLFISHDINVVRLISHRVMVMLGGRICEIMDSSKIISESRHPYTRDLVAHLPGLHRRISRHEVAQALLTGDHGNTHDSCPFYSQCAFSTRKCEIAAPL